MHLYVLLMMNVEHIRLICQNLVMQNKLALNVSMLVKECYQKLYFLQANTLLIFQEMLQQVILQKI